MGQYGKHGELVAKPQTMKAVKSMKGIGRGRWTREVTMKT